MFSPQCFPVLSQEHLIVGRKYQAILYKSLAFVVEELSELERALESRLLVVLTGTVFKIVKILPGSQKFSASVQRKSSL